MIRKDRIQVRSETLCEHDAGHVDDLGYPLLIITSFLATALAIRAVQTPPGQDDDTDEADIRCRDTRLLDSTT
ncbi:hypothetical protein B0I31_120103 [Saccharothrix carnea]|uniref:Uncharacterized protein n=1 Tax=Saccharothrix carnea TaxID=1280637 RepID=A0A2P8HZB0_SACCR|nr:hypothetical protein [Saccharothrix carnea]PSL51569.1 hypothetical protein B0I31_120103 [Saccharothrix carnea]